MSPADRTAGARVAFPRYRAQVVMLFRLERLLAQCSVYDDVIAAAVYAPVNGTSGGTVSMLGEPLTMAALEHKLSLWHREIDQRGGGRTMATFDRFAFGFSQRISLRDCATCDRREVSPRHGAARGARMCACAGLPERRQETASLISR